MLFKFLTKRKDVVRVRCDRGARTFFLAEKLYTFDGKDLSFVELVEELGYEVEFEHPIEGLE